MPLKKNPNLFCVFVCPLLGIRQRARETEMFGGVKKRTGYWWWWLVSAGYDCPEAGRFRVDVLGGRLCLGIIPQGAGFTLLARGDKHALHMLRDDDKGIASLNENGKKIAPPLELQKWEALSVLLGKTPCSTPIIPPSRSSSHKSKSVVFTVHAQCGG